MDRSSPQRLRLWLGLILLMYVGLGGAYAACTPAWQAPDEPAHYNYVRHIVETGALPELRSGDYPAEYLEEIKAARFPRDLSVDPIRYEAHQPPLYYLLAAPAFALGRALGMETPLLPVRLVSLALGGLSLLAAFSLLRTLLPHRPDLALGATAFVAFLPMRLAVTGAANNDALAELVLGLVVWQLLLIERKDWRTGPSLLLGLTVGLAFLTKLQAYIAAPLAFFAWAWAMRRARRSGRPLWPLAIQGALTAGVALAVVAPWLMRNASLYGPGDLLGMVRHDAVAGAQLTTAQFVAERGLVGALKAAALTTFQSFWGQFGWMGVPLPTRIYQALAALAALAILGAVDALSSRRRPAGGGRGFGMLLLAAWGLLTLCGYLWYNLQYVQHQGRYLFPAVAVWGLGYTLGWQQLYTRAPRWVLALLGLAALALAALGLYRGDLPTYALGLTLGGGGLICAGSALEQRWPGLPLAAMCLAQAGLAAWCLTVLVPALTP
ncbi:MAG: DUF2142 domain-containing protein [Chloroflexi bacterium]|nr:DUF2142 domain-containing protein [Chloroflexota bacterium]